MATYAELFDLRSNDALRNRVAVAAIIKAQTILDTATPTAAQVAWAKATLSNPLGVAGDLLNYVLAANKAFTAAQITGAADSAIQTNVNAATDKIISGGA